MRAAPSAVLLLTCLLSAACHPAAGPQDYTVMPSAPASTAETPGVREALRGLRQAGWNPPDPAVVVDVAHQRLLLYRDGRAVGAWRVSTSKYGIGGEPGSYRTPAGLHRIWRKSGASALPGQPLKAGEPTEKPVAENDGSRKRVFITTRALMLEGLEERNAESRKRGIWVHGTSAEDRIGKPASIGCVRMRAVDVIELFDSVQVGTLVYIAPGP